MTKPGRIGPLVLSDVADADGVAAWIREELAAASYALEDRSTLDFIRLNESAIVGFTRKLDKAARRGGRDCNEALADEPLKIWTLTPREGAAGYQYMRLRLLGDREGVDLLQDDDFARITFVLFAVGELFLHAGYPRRTYARAKALVHDYESAASHDAVDIASGQAVRAARRLVARAGEIEGDDALRDLWIPFDSPTASVTGSMSDAMIEVSLRLDDIHRRTSALTNWPSD